MPPPTLVNDALWRCLCPKFQSPTALRNFSRAQSCLVARNGHTQRPTTFRATSRSQIRHVNISAPSRLDTNDLSFGNHRSPVSSISKRSAKPDAPSLVHLPTNALYDRLRRDGAAGRYNEVMNIVKILLKDRRERPNVRMYSAILHSFANCQEGTAGKIRKVMEEMVESGVDLDVGACHNALEALAVHPDYILREEVLSYMKERWFSLNDRGHNMVAAGLLRDRLFEQAIEKIEDMVRQRISVHDWLWDKAVWFFLDYGEVDEAWQLMLLRQQSATGKKDFSKTLLTHFLDVAARLCHVEGVNSIWTTQVIPNYIKPATGTCLDILNLASRTGNVQLATDVFRLLTERKTIFTSHHYEMLLETYLNDKDLPAALSVILIMSSSGIKIDESSIHPLFTHLRSSPTLPLEAVSLLQRESNAGKHIPTAALNSCIQASIHHSNLEEALDIYKIIHTISRGGPTTQTFNILFQGCHKARRKELAMYLASEMVERGIAPDAMTYDRLILVCCNASDDPEDAFAYYEEMRSSGHVPRRGCFEILIDKGVEVGDARTPHVLRDMRDCGFAPKKELVRSVANRFVNARDGEREDVVREDGF
ncbi:hypothetical protein BU24DRAFT_378551 [Aaosphaeria arxii CBS 175.79]|uniref:Pentatricopeptide repeat-containing protein-mitochondrial domain-containing protein n=1 Tax=Aaosphaeria arxii CBS 175.79 TaxID=1450172 RepID=A0A6A5XCG2_9PLEO|nr:uncharacterized protein BU24DRAFT_378551 [Aaosphaeria arxii CBS 175.79]KAF2010497.1 hypothetical protein BU24DRAFT_378551 [Aaosphaeria arxii CBS 175.79]